MQWVEMEGTSRRRSCSGPSLVAGGPCNFQLDSGSEVEVEVEVEVRCLCLGEGGRNTHQLRATRSLCLLTG